MTLLFNKKKLENLAKLKKSYVLLDTFIFPFFKNYLTIIN